MSMTLEEAMQEIFYHAFVFTLRPKKCLEALKVIRKTLLDYIEIDEKLRMVNEENGELKRLLRLAVDDLDKSIKACENDMLCEICIYEAECNCVNYCFVDKNLRSWKHRDEAMELLKEGTE